MMIGVMNLFYSEFISLQCLTCIDAVRVSSRVCWRLSCLGPVSLIIDADEVCKSKSGNCMIFWRFSSLLVSHWNRTLSDILHRFKCNRVHLLRVVIGQWTCDGYRTLCLRVREPSRVHRQCHRRRVTGSICFALRAGRRFPRWWRKPKCFLRASIV